MMKMMIEVTTKRNVNETFDFSFSKLKLNKS